MRVVILCASPYSEVSCAVAVRLSRLGYVPVGALSLSSWNARTLIRKWGQWGLGRSLRYGRAKLGSRSSTNALLNPYLESTLRNDDGVFRSLKQVARAFLFPVAVCGNHNSAHALVKLKQWLPDLIIFTGGDIVRGDLLEIPRLGVLNVHLGLLPEVRGMSTPEWSLLLNLPLGITIHLLDRGIDTGPILLRHEFSITDKCHSLDDLRHRMVAHSIDLIAQAVAGLDRGTSSPKLQEDRDRDRQYFVMHELLRARAVRKLREIGCPGGKEQ